MNSPTHLTHSPHRKSADRPKRVGSEKDSSSPAALLRSAFLGLLCTAGVSLLFLLIAAFAAYSGDDPNALSRPLSQVALYAAAFFAGLITVRIHGHSSLLCGGVAAILFLALCALVGAFLPDSPANGLGFGISLLLRVPVVGLSLAGAFVGRKREKRKRRRR